MKKLSIIVPVFNEEETVAEVVKRIIKAQTPGFKKEIVVINDASADKTGAILTTLHKKYRFVLVSHQRNRGKGGAIKTALRHVTGDAVLTQDADLEYDPSDYKKLLAAYDSNRAPVVYGTRKHSRSKRGYLICYVCGQALTLLNNILYGSSITDINTGYKLIRTDIIKSADLQVDGFDFCHEITAKVLKAGYKIKEVPINYYPRSYAEGKKVMIGDALLDLWTTIKYRFVD